MIGRRFLLQAAPAALGAAAVGGASRPVGGIVPPATGADQTAVHTTSGAVRGVLDDGVRAFLGIPYGNVPGRFQAPRPAAAWSGTRDASHFGPVATQMLAATNPPVASSEQCLSVNVWSPVAPAVAQAPLLPVLVWIHGGANVSGASSQPIYDGRHFARSGVVCVTFNYRLGVFGFLELGDLMGGRYRHSGNNALRDQILLLHWVQENIAAFGGDPKRITIAGESAGAKDVAALLAVPSAQGLFHRAILESGGGRTVLSMAAAHEMSRRYLDLLGLPADRADRLLDLDTDTLVSAQRALMLQAPLGYPLRPLVDGVLMPQMPEVAVALGHAAGVPLLLGTNRDESRLFLGKDAASRPIAGHSLSNMGPDGFERMLMRYDASMRGPDLAQIRWRALTAEEYWIPSVRVAEAQSSAGGMVWMYRFDKSARSGPFEGRAAHVSELPYIWNNPDDPQLAQLTAGFDPKLAHRMHAAWLAFIKGGSPDAPGLPTWPRYDAQSRATMIFDNVSRVENDPDRTERQLWSSLFLADAVH